MLVYKQFLLISRLHSAEKLGIIYIMKPKGGIPKRRMTKIRKLNSNSKFLKSIVCCLLKRLHANVIKCINHGEFTVKLLHNKNPTWDPSYIKPFECIERFLGIKRYEKYKFKKSYQNECKQRFKANMRKLVESKCLEYLGEKKLGDNSKERHYRFANFSEEFVSELFPDNGKMEEVFLYMKGGSEENLNEGSQEITSLYNYHFMDTGNVPNSSPDSFGSECDLHSPFKVTGMALPMQEDCVENVDTGDPRYKCVKTVSVPGNTCTFSTNSLQTNSAPIPIEFIEASSLYHETASSAGNVFTNNGIVPNSKPITDFEGNYWHQNLIDLPHISGGDFSLFGGRDFLLSENEESCNINSLLDDEPTVLKHQEDPMLSSTNCFPYFKTN